MDDPEAEFWRDWWGGLRQGCGLTLMIMIAYGMLRFLLWLSMGG